MPEHTIAENLTRLQNAKTAIGNAISNAGGTVGANDGLEDFATDIGTIPSGGGGSSATRKDVNFYDYDGTIVNSYTAADFANLTELPENPTHEGLTAQGWNWSLSDAKTYVASYGNLDIGQMYVTSDSKTRFHISLSKGRLKPYLGLTGNSSGTAVSIDWGDGSTAESVTLNTSTIYTPHEYASDGEYVVSITVTSGTISLTGSASNYANLFRKSSSPNANNDKVYANVLTKAELGTGVTFIGKYAFSYCYSLTSVTIPSTVTSIINGVFSYCYSLTSITIPSEVSSIGSTVFQQCYGLGFIKFESTTPPTVSASNTWDGLPTDCIIYVPSGSLSTYTSANNYPSSSTYTYVEY